MAEQSSSSDAQSHSQQLFEAEPRLHLTGNAVLLSDVQKQLSTLTGNHLGAEQKQLSTLTGNHLGAEQNQKLSQRSDISGDQQAPAMRQQACATDDGDFERMMARFAELEKQEAAQSGKGLAGMQCTLSVLCDNICSPHKLCLFTYMVARSMSHTLC